MRDRAHGQVRARRRAGQRGPLEVEAEVGQALRRPDRQVGVRAREEEVRGGVVGDVQVGVDALVAAVALVRVHPGAEGREGPRARGASAALASSAPKAVVVPVAPAAERATTKATATAATTRCLHTRPNALIPYLHPDRVPMPATRGRPQGESVRLNNSDGAGTSAMLAPMIRRCQQGDFEAIYAIVNDAAGRIAA